MLESRALPFGTLCYGCRATHLESERFYRLRYRSDLPQYYSLVN